MARICPSSRLPRAGSRLRPVLRGAAALVGAGLVATACTTAPAAGPSPPASAASPALSLTEQGRAFVTARCSTCHAVERGGDSPVAEAPAFRTLSARYPLENLAEGLAEGLYVGHPVMPEFELTPEEVDAVIAWIGSIQDVPLPEAPPPRSP